jgi:aminoglycoside phosphotransferase (APT) family kinase protein
MANDVNQLDTASLQKYLATQIENFGAIDSCEKFAGGQSNPTFLIKAGERKYVLRRKPPGLLLKSAHAVDREYRVMKALENSPIPVPKMLVLCSDESVIGSMFYLMEYIEGRIFWNSTLPEVSNSERSAMYDEMVRLLAAMHSLDLDARGLRDYGKPGNYFSRQVTRWSEQYRAGQTRQQPAMETLMAWLNANIPADDGRVALIHGDFRFDNVIFHPTEPRVIAVLDWELSTLGHPWSDIAYQCMQLRLPENFIIPGLGGCDRAALGIPSETEYLARYCELTKIDNIPLWDFCVVFSFFRLAAILEGVYKRSLDGNASSTKAAQYGAVVEPMAELALSALSG